MSETRTLTAWQIIVTSVSIRMIMYTHNIKRFITLNAAPVRLICVMTTEGEIWYFKKLCRQSNGIVVPLALKASARFTGLDYCHMVCRKTFLRDIVPTPLLPGYFPTKFDQTSFFLDWEEESTDTTLSKGLTFPASSFHINFIMYINTYAHIICTPMHTNTDKHYLSVFNSITKSHTF